MNQMKQIGKDEDKSGAIGDTALTQQVIGCAFDVSPRVEVRRIQLQPSSESSAASDSSVDVLYS